LVDTRPCVFAPDPVHWRLPVFGRFFEYAHAIIAVLLPILKENPKEAEIVSHRLMCAPA